MNNYKPKILVISHNCFSESTANGRTLSSFFRNWDKKDLAQFFVNDEVPESLVCENFYRITDKDLLQSLILNKDFSGELDSFSKKKCSKANKKKIKLNRVKKIKKLFPSFLYLSRTILWTQGKYKKKLNFWIDKFQPDIVFLYPGDYSFLYKIGRKIAKTKNIPLVIFNSEDYFLKDYFSLSPLYYIQRYFFKKEVKNAFGNASLVIYSNNLLKDNFHKYFSCPSTVIMTSSEMVPSHENLKNKSLRFVYAGNLGHERWKSLIEIGKAIQEKNKEIFIEVYSGFLPKEAEKNFTKKNGIDFKGSVSYNEVLDVINKSDVVIHTEGFSEFTKKDIRHGFSTKIADLLSSEKCFLMFGPKEVACVDYLKKNEAAWVATSKEELTIILEKILNSKTERDKFLNNAKNLIEMRHNKEKNCQHFENLLLDVYQGFNSRFS